MEKLNYLFVDLAQSLRSWFAGMGLSPFAIDMLVVLVAVVGIITFVLLNVLYLVYLERKISAYFQDRLGPNRVGPRGLLQTTMDVLKLIGKEDIRPTVADRWVFFLAPVIVFVPAVMMYAVVPFGEGMIAVDLNIGIFYFIAISSTTTIAFLMAGWGSNNKYSLLGGMRTVAQMVSYEIPLVFSLLGVIMLTGSLKMSDIVAAQKDMWFIVLQPVAFLIFFIAATAELNRGPFDLPEGEQEIIAGPHTEYSGMKFAMFFLAEYANLVSVSAIAVTLFLGGWRGPWLPSWLWFLIKLYGMILLFMWVRWTYPRIRIDHLMHLNWKFLLPLSFVNILVTGVGIKLYQWYQAMGWGW
ncbi:NADH-quinone oxidoreductase subunit NuoH [Calderihabitans maritimus]|uniref:NADH-quinone oxidoreductase subunit H n=1 Tax=Calderihabitans maritimus TaxID=1246530 RepID=A0A1Z5HTJ3_9FIRM|nr:NADH-quinone oxidoreductase subunit NuoH [Calderihabitans maritimus]GAW92852.1 respiratory-chain NADH dehydrogenase subunit 1 [Calderihabitans maritimus]